MSAGTIPNASGVQRLEGWIAAYGTGILRTCYLYLRDAALAQDAMQDTFVKAWRKMDTFEGRNGSSEKTWLTHIAINTCRDYRRSRWLRFVDMRQSIEELPLPVHQVTPEERELFQSVLALLLAAAGAVAAVLLGGKDFTSQVVAPIATQSESETFTQAEVGRILELARENGIEVPENLTAHWETWGGEYKEELMRALVKTELGFYPGSWSLEDQHWYNKLLVECGLSDGISCLLPGSDDFTQEEVLNKAVQLFTEAFHPEEELTDDSKYRRSLTFTCGTDSTYRTVKQWAVSFEALNGGREYIFTMLANGLVTDLHVCDPSNNDYASGLSDGQVFYDFQVAFGESPLDWTLEELELFYHTVAMARGESIDDPGIYQISQTRYLLPGQIYTYMAEEAAIVQAREACGADKSLTPYVIYIGDDPGNVHWKISFRDASGAFVSFAQIDGSADAVKDGKGIVTAVGNYADKPWYAPLVREEVLPGYKAREAKRALKRPAQWRSPLLSDTYWETLEALGYQEETAQKLEAQWQAAYDPAGTWPAAQSAVKWWWDFDPDIAGDNVAIPGLPEEARLTPAQSLGLAEAAFKAAAEKVYTPEQLQNTLCLNQQGGLYYLKDAQGRYTRFIWQFDFQVEAGDERYMDTIVEVEDSTGEVLPFEVSQEIGNG